MKSGILEGMVVLDLSRWLSGPQCTLLLAGFGAEVIKIDDPSAGDPTVEGPPFVGKHGVSFTRHDRADYGIAYLKRARGKKSITLDLKKPEGQELFRGLVKAADVIVENFRVGVTKRLGIDYETLGKLNERLVYCSITGYGSTGPDARLKAYDPLIQAATGFMSINGQPGSEPLKAGSALGDTLAGSFAAMGVISALLHREKTGLGQYIDVSMAECMLSLILDEPLDIYEQLKLNPQQGNHIMRLSPVNTYRSADGWIAICAHTTLDWNALLELMGRADLKSHPDWSRMGWRIQNNPQVDELISNWAREFPTGSLVEKMNAKEIPCSPVRSGKDVLAWPQMQERNALPKLRLPDGDSTDVVGPGFPLKFSNATTGYEVPAPVPGLHTAEVLQRFLAIDSQRIGELRLAKVI